MAADPHPQLDARVFPAEGPAADGQPAPGAGGETLAEKIHRYRRLGAEPSGGAPAPGTPVARHPREE